MLNPWVGLQNTLVILFVPGRKSWYETVDPLVGRYEDLKLLDVGTYNQFCRSSSGWLWAPRIMLYGFRAKSYNGFGTNNWSGQIQRPQQSANYNLRPVRGAASSRNCHFAKWTLTHSRFSKKYKSEILCLAVKRANYNIGK